MAADRRKGLTGPFTFFFRNSSPFSQFHPANFTVNGIQYSCAEQYMMHQKAVLFKDDAIAEQILAAAAPKQMKSLGRKVSNFIEEEWRRNRERIVKEGNMAKFSQNEDLREILFGTEGTTLVEASPFDRIWGIGMGENNPLAKDPSKWKGQNLLGFIITEVREELMHKS